MIRVSVLYPNTSGAKFDRKYYMEKHMPLVRERLEKYGLVRVEVDKGLGSMGGAPAPFVYIAQLQFDSVENFQKGMEAHGQELLADIPNYTSVQPQVQVSELLSV